MVRYVIFYRQYGEWSCTMPFVRERDAERHADLYLRGEGNEHKEDITLVAVDLPE